MNFGFYNKVGESFCCPCTSVYTTWRKGFATQLNSDIQCSCTFTSMRDMEDHILEMMVVSKEYFHIAVAAYVLSVFSSVNTLQEHNFIKKFFGEYIKSLKVNVDAIKKLHVVSNFHYRKFNKHKVSCSKSLIDLTHEGNMSNEIVSVESNSSLDSNELNLECSEKKIQIVFGNSIQNSSYKKISTEPSTSTESNSVWKRRMKRLSNRKVPLLELASLSSSKIKKNDNQSKIKVKWQTSSSSSSKEDLGSIKKQLFNSNMNKESKSDVKSDMTRKRKMSSKSTSSAEQDSMMLNIDYSESSNDSDIEVNAQITVSETVYYSPKHFVMVGYNIETSNFNQIYFSRMNFLSIRNMEYYNKFVGTNYIDVYKNISALIKAKTTARRNNNMYCFGCTMYAGQYPKFCPNNEQPQRLKMLPRPYACYRPNNNAWKYTQKKWFMSFVQDVAMITKEHLYHYKSKSSDVQGLLNMIDFIEREVPKSLRICNTFFTQMVMCSDINVDSYMSKHLDEKDLITSFITFGKVKTGGKTRYYTGSSATNTLNKVVHEVAFEHGQIQIGQLNKIVHAVQPWTGSRITFNFNVKSDVINHFREYGSKYYKIYEQSNFKEKFIYDKNIN